MAESALSHQVEVTGISEVYLTPAPRGVWNEFDEFGLLLGVARLTEEPNWEYKRRLMDTFIHRANSTYRGLVYGISRELGCDLYNPIMIYPRTSGDGFLAPDPYIKIDGAWIYLYSDYANDEYELRIDRFEPGNYDRLGWLADKIHNMTYFDAVLTNEDYHYKRSMVLLNQSNRLTIREAVGQTTRFRLEHTHIATGSVSFLHDTATFAREVPTEGDVVATGRYWIDYDKGIVSCYSTPLIGATIQYNYTVPEWRPTASDVILYDINSENFKVKLFEQVLQDDGTYVNGLPNELGTDLINELLRVVPMYWGT